VELDGRSRSLSGKVIYAPHVRRKAQSINRLIIDDVIVSKGVTERRNARFEARGDVSIGSNDRYGKRTSMERRTSMRAQRNAQVFSARAFVSAGDVICEERHL
jgi:hypothetical protein